MKKLLFAVALLGIIFTAGAVKMSDLKIYINPGHGGYDSDDRPIGIYPFVGNDTAGYWESKSNLYKGLHMYYILDSIGAKPYLSRIKNRTEDDRSLSSISAEANNLGCDLFFSIHSNAGETVNYPLMLYRENAVGTPRYPEAITLSNLLWDNLHSSQLSLWTRHTRYCSGDLTFYPQWGTSGLGVLRNLYVVGLLSEGGMHEHRPEAHRLMSDDFWWLEAWHFVKTIMEFYDTEDRFVTGNVAGVVYDNNNTRENTLNLNYYSAYGRDRNRPLNGVLTELLDTKGNVLRRHLTDDMNNGVYLFRNVEPGNYTVRTSLDGYHTQEYPVEVKACEVTYHDVPLVQIQTEKLLVKSYSPCVGESELVSAVSPIVIEFNQDIDAETFKKAFSITPAVDYQMTFSDSYSKVTIKPDVAFATSTTYTVTVSTDLQTPDKESAMCNLEQALTFSFTTKGRNRLELISTFPQENGVVHYKGASLEFRFDARVDKSNMFTKLIKVYDENGNALSANTRSCTANKLSNGYGNAIFVVSQDLVPAKKYRVELSPEIKDLEGVPLTDPVVINFVATDESHNAAEGDVVIEEFETADVLTYSAEASQGMATSSSFYTVSSKALYGNNALQSTYSFSAIRGGEAIFDYAGGMKVVKRGDKVGVHVFGDLNNHELSFGFTSGADTKYFKVCDLDFLGWHYYEMTLDALEENYDYIFTNVRLRQSEGLYNQSGSFYLDNMLLSASSGVEAINADRVMVDTESVPGMVVVKGIDTTPRLMLYNMQGLLVNSSVDAALSIKNLPAGVYLLSIETATVHKVEKIIVK